MTALEIRKLIAIDIDGNGRRDKLIVVGVYEPSGLIVGPRVALFDGQVPFLDPTSSPELQLADGVLNQAATLLASGTSAFDVSPTGHERVFTAEFLLSGTIFAGECGTILNPPLGVGVLAVAHRHNVEGPPSFLRDTFFGNSPLECIPLCPSITWHADIPFECNDDATRHVIITATISASPGTSYSAELLDPQHRLLDRGSSQPDGILILRSDEPHPPLIARPQILSTEDYIYYVVFTSGLPEQCDDSNTFSIPDCPGGQQPPCPDFSDVAVQIGERCEAGRRRVRFTATVTGTAGQSLDSELVLMEPDGTERVIQTRNDPVSQQFSYSEALLPGNYIVTLRTSTPVGCETPPKPFTVLDCPEDPSCPEVNDINVQISEICEDGRRTVALTTTVNGAIGSSALVLTEPDGTEQVLERQDNPGLQSFAQQRDLLPGDYTVELRTGIPDDCDTKEPQNFSVPPCEVQPPNDPLCPALELVWVFSWIIGFVSLMLAMAIPPAAQVFAVIFIILFLIGMVALFLWILLCKPTRCRILRDFFWIITWVSLIGSLIFFFAPQVLPILFVFAVLAGIVLLLINQEPTCRAPSPFEWPFG